MLALGETIATAPGRRDASTRPPALFAAALPGGRGADRACARRPSVAPRLRRRDARRRRPTTRPRAPTGSSPAGSERRSRRRRPIATGRGRRPTLTYENALPVRAPDRRRRAASAIRRHGRRRASRVLDWLIDVQTAADGHFSPIGNGWWPRGGERVAVRPAADRGDRAAARRRGGLRRDRRRRATATAMERAYAWFLGENDLGIAGRRPGDAARCHDGLTPRRRQHATRAPSRRSCG